MSQNEPDDPVAGQFHGGSCCLIDFAGNPDEIEYARADAAGGKMREIAPALLCQQFARNDYALDFRRSFDDFQYLGIAEGA
jgi:hypothetical protein